MVRKVFFLIPQLFLKFIHPTHNSITYKEIGIIVAIINSAQQIAITHDQQYNINQEFRFIFYFSQYCLFVDINIYSYYMQNLIIQAFILNTLLTICFGFILFKQSKDGQFKNYELINFLVLYYPQLFYIPIVYTSIKYFSEIDTIEFQYIPLILINMIIGILIKTLHIYFCRTNKLMGNNNILQLKHSLIINIIQEVILSTSIILKVQNILTIIRLIISNLNIFISLIQILKQQNCQIYTHIYVFSFITNISIYLNISILEYLIFCCLIFATSQHIMNVITQMNLFRIKNQNIITLQIQEKYKMMNTQESDLILMAIFQIHKKQFCKCKSFQNMINCNFKSIIKYNQNPDEILLYCDYIKETLPLKATIQIFRTKNKSFYFKFASMLLLQKLLQQSQQLASESQKIKSLSSDKDNENLQKLSTDCVFTTLQIPDQIFPLFNQIIKLKINFWLHLIKGYSDIKNCIDDILQLSQQMLCCKQKIEELYDLKKQKLLNFIHKDLITMKILQIYHCTIYDNKYISFQLQQEMNEILKTDSLLQDEFLNNYKLAKNKVFLFQTSLSRNNGELLNLNINKLSYYFETNVETLLNLKYYTQLMPDFISREHSKFVKSFIQRGYSDYENQQINTFLQNTHGYIEQCQLNFNHFYTNDDFIMNLILTKNQQRDLLIFGVDGVILGVTKQFFEEVVSSNITIGSYTHTSKDSKQDDASQIKNYLQHKPLIQFYIPNITDQILSFQKQNKMTQQNYLNNVKSTWIIPYNHSDCLNFSETFLQQYKQVQRKLLKTKSYVQNQQIHDTKQEQPQNLILKHHKNHKNAQTFIYSSDIFCEFQEEIQINGIPILMLHPSMQDQLFDFVDFGDVSKSIYSLTLQYNLEFNSLQYEYGRFGYFVVKIQEYKTLHTTTILQATTGKNTLLKVDAKEDSINQEFSQQQINQADIQSQKQDQELSDSKQGEKNLYINSIIQNCDQLNFSELNQELMQIKYAQKQSDSNLQIDTFRGNQQGQTLIQKSKFSENFNLDDVDLNDHQSQTIKKPKLDTKRQKQKRKHSKFHNKTKNTNTQTKAKNIQPGDFNHDFASNPSRSSVASTQKEIQFLIEQLYFKQNLVLPLKKIAFILLFTIFSIFMCGILNYYIIKNNLDYQIIGVQNLLNPQNVTYFYSSVSYQMWSVELHNQNVSILSPFQYENNLETMSSMFQNGRSYLPQLNIKIPQLAESQNIYNYDIKFIINGTQILKSQNQGDFFIMLNQIVEQQFREYLNNNNSNMNQLYTSGFIRQNLIDLFEEINKLIQPVIDQTESSLFSGQSTFTSSIFIQLMTILSIFLITLKYWIFIDQLQKSIIFLLSMINENQALKYVATLNIFKQYIEDQFSNKWMEIDFNEIEYDNDKEKKIIFSQKNIKINKRSENSLYSRIIITKYYSKKNFIILSIIILSWILFQLIGYILFLQNNSLFEPSLLATLKFGQFRIKMDISSFLGGLTKSENLIEANNLSFINQTQVISLLFDCKNQLVSEMERIAVTILEKANNNQNQFNELLNGNICEQFTWDQMKSCDPSYKNLPYNSSDVIYDVMKHGILGYTSAFIKYLDSDFDYEFKNLIYESKLQNLQSIKSSNFQNYFLSYYIDIQDSFLRFLNQFKIENETIAAQYIEIMRLYYLLVGALFVISLIILIYIQINYFNKRISKIRQVLVLVHTELIQNQNMKSRAKLILKWLY